MWGFEEGDRENLSNLWMIEERIQVNLPHFLLPCHNFQLLFPLLQNFFYFHGLISFRENVSLCKLNLNVDWFRPVTVVSRIH